MATIIVDPSLGSWLENTSIFQSSNSGHFGQRRVMPRVRFYFNLNWCHPHMVQYKSAVAGAMTWN
jgi:hypothetical protein